MQLRVYVQLLLAISSLFLIRRWCGIFSTSLSYVNVTGPRTGVPQVRFSSGFVPTLLDALKCTSEEFTPMRTTKRVDVKGAHRKIRTVLLSGSLSLSFSLSAEACKARAAFEWYYRFRVSQTWPCYNRDVPLSTTCSPRREKYPPLSCREFVHALRDDHVESSIVHICILSEVVCVKKSPGISEDARRCSDFFETHVRVIPCVARVSQH